MSRIYRYICRWLFKRRYWISYITYDENHWFVYASRMDGSDDILIKMIEVIEGVNEVEAYEEALAIADRIEGIPIEFYIDDEDNLW